METTIKTTTKKELVTLLKTLKENDTIKCIYTNPLSEKEDDITIDKFSKSDDCYSVYRNRFDSMNIEKITTNHIVCYSFFLGIKTIAKISLNSIIIKSVNYNNQ